jgi:hypothetical protein
MRSLPAIGLTVAAVVLVLLAGVGLSSWRARRPAGAAAQAADDVFRLDDATIPDDPTLLAELEKAIDLRRRENFDRVLDAREPGELVEHATLTEETFRRASLGVDRLFVVGDELFAYLFRPENGWGSGADDRQAIGYTPQLHRIQRGPSGSRCFCLLALPLGRGGRRAARRRRTHFPAATASARAASAQRPPVLGWSDVPGA